MTRKEFYYFYLNLHLPFAYEFTITILNWIAMRKWKDLQKPWTKMTEISSRFSCIMQRWSFDATSPNTSLADDLACNISDSAASFSSGGWKKLTFKLVFNVKLYQERLRKLQISPGNYIWMSCTYKKEETLSLLYFSAVFPLIYKLILQHVLINVELDKLLYLISL